MNIVFCHINQNFSNFYNDNYSFNHIPDYAFLTFEQTRYSNKTSEIYLICDQNMLYDNEIEHLKKLNIHIIDQKDIITDKILQVKNEYSTNLVNYSLMNFNFVTLIRFYFVEEMMKKYNLCDVFHLEYDNLLYVDLNKIILILNKLCYFGKVNNKNLIGGITYFHNYQILEEINIKILKILKCKKIQNVTEMLLFGELYNNEPELIGIFNHFPHSNENYIFDPCSYGQYIAGTNNNHSCGFIDETHDVGKFLKTNIHKISFNKNNEITMIFNDKKYKFVNLHIHNKKAIEDFITYER